VVGPRQPTSLLHVFLDFLRFREVQFEWNGDILEIANPSALSPQYQASETVRVSTNSRTVALFPEDVELLTFGHPLLEAMHLELSSVLPYEELSLRLAGNHGLEHVRIEETGDFAWKEGAETFDELLIAQVDCSIFFNGQIHNETLYLLFDVKKAKPRDDLLQRALSLMKEAPKQKIQLSGTKADPSELAEGLSKSLNAKVQQLKQGWEAIAQEAATTDLDRARKGGGDVREYGVALETKYEVRVEIKYRMITRLFLSRRRGELQRKDGKLGGVAKWHHSILEDRTVFEYRDSPEGGSTSVLLSAASPLHFWLCSVGHLSLSPLHTCHSTGSLLCPVCSGSSSISGRFYSAELLTRCSSHPDEQCGPDEGVRCSACTEFVCHATAKKCAATDRFVCPKHSVRSGISGEWFHYKVVSYCVLHPGEACGPLEHERCAECRVTACRPSMGMCSITGKLVCNRCLVTCHTTGRKLRRSETSICSSCLKVYSRDLVTKTDYLDKPCCAECTRRCITCENSVSSEDAYHDEVTAVSFCPHHGATCEMGHFFPRPEDEIGRTWDGGWICADHGAKCAECDNHTQKTRMSADMKVLCPAHSFECSGCGEITHSSQRHQDSQTLLSICSSCIRTCPECQRVRCRTTIAQCSHRGCATEVCDLSQHKGRGVVYCKDHLGIDENSGELVPKSLLKVCPSCRGPHASWLSSDRRCGCCRSTRFLLNSQLSVESKRLLTSAFSTSKGNWFVGDWAGVRVFVHNGLGGRRLLKVFPGDGPGRIVNGGLRRLFLGRTSKVWLA
jgi:hypothetical protein